MNLEELKEEYKKSKENDELIEITPRTYEYKNEGYRRELQKQADLLLTEQQQLAIYMHKKTCSYSHVDQCNWYYEIKDLTHDWKQFEHKRYLEKAIEILKLIDFKTAKKVIDNFII